MNQPFVIAEVGSNWQSIEDCKESIVKAKQSGADAVKFQLFSYEELYGYKMEKDPVILAHAGNDNPHLKGLDLLQALPRDWIPILAQKAKDTGIEFMCTAFSPEGYRFIDEFVTRHKVASSEMCHKRILETLRELKKPVILSTGAQTMSDIRYALDFLGDLDVTVLYCEGSYPAKWTDLHKLLVLHENLGVPVGYSDHTTSIIDIPRLADRLGATVIEKHFKIRDMDSPDNGHSILPHEFKVMVSAIRMNVDPIIGPTPDELPMVLRHKRRLIAKTDIFPGDIMKEEVNFGIYRSLIDDSKALHPFLVDQVNGKRAKFNIKAGQGVGPGDIE